MAGAWGLYWTEIAFDVELGGQFLIWTPLIAMGFACLRLIRAQKTFSAALANLEQAILKKGKSLAVALRLTDAEIALFARLSPEEILAYAAKEKEIGLRWRQLFYAYFN